MRVWLSVWVFSLVLDWPARLVAEPATNPLALNYRTPDECPPAASFSASVMRLVGSVQKLTRHVKADIEVRGSTRGGFQLILLTDVDGIPGERVLRGRSCESVTDAAAVTLAILLNPEVAPEISAQTEAPPVVEGPPEAEARPNQPLASATPTWPDTRSAMRPSRQREAAQTRLRWTGAASLGADIGVLPQPGAELSIGVGAVYERWSVLVSGYYAPPASVHAPGQARAGGRLWHGTVLAAACASHATSTPRFGMCFGGAHTRVQGRGFGVANPREGSTAWGSIVAGVFGELGLSDRGAFRVSASLLVPMARPDSHLDELGILQRPSFLTGKLQAGVILAIP